MKRVAEVLEVARSHLHDRLRTPATPRSGYRKADDEDLDPPSFFTMPGSTRDGERRHSWRDLTGWRHPGR